MSYYEKFTMVFLMTTLLGVGYMIYSAGTAKFDCVQSAVAQNYSSDQIKKICR